LLHFALSLNVQILALNCHIGLTSIQICNRVVQFTLFKFIIIFCFLYCNLSTILCGLQLNFQIILNCLALCFIISKFFLPIFN